MAKDGGRIEIKIGADASELEAELGRASSALADTAADATKLGDKVDDAADEMKASAKKMGTLSESAQNTTDEFGELSSGMGALASALDVVDPRLGAATRGLGDLAGASEGAMRLSKLQSGALSSVLTPAVGVVALAVTGLAATYLILKRDANKASAAFEAQAERMAELKPLIDQLASASLDYAVAAGNMTKEDADQIRIDRQLNETWAERRTEMVQGLSEQNIALEEQQDRLENLRLEMTETLMARSDLNREEAYALALSEGGNRAQYQFAGALQEAIGEIQLGITVRQNELDQLNRQISTVGTLTTETAALSAATADNTDDTDANTDANDDNVRSRDDMRASVEAARDALLELDRASENRRNAMEAEGDLVLQLEEKRRLALQTVAEEEEKRLEATREFTAGLIELGADAEAAAIASQERITQAHEAAAEERLEIEEHFDAKIQEAIAQQIAAEEERRIREAAAATAAIELRDAQWLEDRQRIQDRADFAIAEEERIRKERNDTLQAGLSAAQDLAGSLTELGQQRLAFLTREGDKMTEAQKKGALKQFKINKALAITEAGMDAASASLKAYAAYAAIPPLAATMSALAFSIAGIKVAMIAATPPPEFREGGIVPGAGETQITAHAGEGVLTASATSSLGGKAGIDALNNGDISSQLGSLIGATESIGSQVASAVATQPMVVQMVYDNQTFNAFIVDNLRQPNAPLAGYIKGKGGMMGLFS